MSVWAYTRPDGFQDHHPEAARRRAQIEETILALCRSRGFERVMVPVLEYADLYDRRRIGDDLYHQLLVSRIAESRQFPPQAERGDPVMAGEPEATHEVVLRPDLTSPVARAFVSRLLEQGVPSRLPVRLCYAGDVFRNVTPAFGATKEFRQVGVESVGCGGLPVDLDVLALACDVAGALDIDAWTLSLGHARLCAAMTEALGVTEPRVRNAVVAGLRRYHRYAQRLRARGGALEAEARRVDFEVFGMGPGGPEQHRAPIDRNRILERLAERLQRTWTRVHGLDEALSRQLLDLVKLDPEPDMFLAEVRRLVPVGPALGTVLDELHALVDGVRATRSVRVEMSPVPGRPIGYYTGVTFELYGWSAAGAWTRFCGGGRYDQLYAWIRDRAVQTARVAGARDGAQIPGDALRGIGFAFGVDRVLEVCRLDPVPVREIRVSAADSTRDLDAFHLSDRLRKQVAERVVWYPACQKGRGGGREDPWYPGTDVVLQLLVKDRDGETLVVVDPAGSRTWTGTPERVAAAVSGAVAPIAAASGKNGTR